MSDSFLMNILHSDNQLSVNVCSLLFLDPLFLDNFFEQIPSFSIFHDEVKLLLCFDYLIELDNKGMSQFFENF